MNEKSERIFENDWIASNQTSKDEECSELCGEFANVTYEEMKAAMVAMDKRMGVKCKNTRSVKRRRSE